MYFCLLSNLQRKVINSKLKIHSEVGESSTITFTAMLKHLVLQPPVDKEKGSSALQQDMLYFIYTH